MTRNEINYRFDQIEDKIENAVRSLEAEIGRHDDFIRQFQELQAEVDHLRAELADYKAGEGDQNLISFH